MPGIPTQLFDGGNQAKITQVGAQIVAPYAYNLVEFRALDLDDTAYNFYKPIVGKQFVISNIYAIADKQVSGTVSSTVVIYEATSATSTTESKILLQTAMAEFQIQPFTNINVLVNEGMFINAKTDDDDVHMNIMGYYIPTVPENA
jgi:hypothetical protein